jgi:hypothetical protein
VGNFNLHLNSIKLMEICAPANLLAPDNIVVNGGPVDNYSPLKKYNLLTFHF